MVQSYGKTTLRGVMLFSGYIYYRTTYSQIVEENACVESSVGMYTDYASYAHIYTPHVHALCIDNVRSYYHLLR